MFNIYSSSIPPPSKYTACQSVQTSPKLSSEFNPATQNDAVKLELAGLYNKYEALRMAKERNDAKHAKDYDEWRKFKEWICTVDVDADDAARDRTPLTRSKKKHGRRRLSEIRERYSELSFNLQGDENNPVGQRISTPSASESIFLLGPSQNL